MNDINVLIVDDEPRYLKLLSYNLKTSGYKTITAGTGEEALSTILEKNVDLVILDILLPGIDGYEVLARIREFSSVPVIMLTARGQEEEKVHGLRLGADDYITKPFGAAELMARVETVLRRSRGPEAKIDPIIVIGKLTIDVEQRKVTIGKGEITLSPTEYRLLYFLAVNAGRVLVQEELLKKVWGSQYRENYEGLRVYIRRLRQKIEEDPEHPAYIITKHGVGYTLAVPN